MLDEPTKRAYEQQWEARERERIARIKAARERGRTAFAMRIDQGADRLRREKKKRDNGA